MAGKRSFPIVTVTVVVLAAAFVALERRRDARFKDAVAEARQKAAAEVEAVKADYSGYWPRFEATAEALALASNELARAAADLAAERQAAAPLRRQYETLSAERIAQAAREADLRKRTEAAEIELANSKGRLDDIVAKHLAAENKRQELEEGMRSRDAELAHLRDELQNEKANLARLEEANRCVPELQNENAAMKRERDEARQALEAAKAKVGEQQTALDSQKAQLDQLIQELQATKAATAGQ